MKKTVIKCNNCDDEVKGMYYGITLFVRDTNPKHDKVETTEFDFCNLQCLAKFFNYKAVKNGAVEERVI